MRYLTGLTAAFLAIAPASAAQDSGVIEMDPHRLRTEDGLQYQAEFGSLTVPENRSDPDSNVITLGIMRVKSLNPEAGAPIFFLAQDPGDSSILELEHHLNDSRELLELGDLIAVDQRGVGRSRPVLARRFSRELPLDQPIGKQELLDAYCEVVYEARTYWRAQDVDLARYNTVEAADDVNAVREALGYESMRLYGGSYGTQLGLTIIRRHGENVAGAVLAGVEGPNQTFKTPKQIDRGLEELDALVARDEVISEHIPSFLSLVRKVLRRFKKEPMRVDVNLGDTLGVQTVALSKFDVQYWTATALGRDDMLINIPAVYYAMSHNDYSTVAEFAARTRTIGIVSAMAGITDCASGISDERRKRIAKEAKRAVLGDTVNFPYPDICDCWGVPSLDATFREPVRTNVPVLLISGAYDPYSPLSDVFEMLPNMPNSRLVVIRNAAHDSRLFHSREAIQAAARYFQDGSIESEIIDMPEFRFTPLSEYE